MSNRRRSGGADNKDLEKSGRRQKWTVEQREHRQGGEKKKHGLARGKSVEDSLESIASSARENPSSGGLSLSHRSRTTHRTSAIAAGNSKSTQRERKEREIALEKKGAFRDRRDNEIKKST